MWYMSVVLLDIARTHAIGKGREGDERMLEAINVSHWYQCQENIDKVWTVNYCAVFTLALSPRLSRCRDWIA